MDSNDNSPPSSDLPSRWRRSFVAGGATQPASSLVAGVAERDDLPILTEIIDEDEILLAEAAGEAVPLVAPERIEALARELLFERLPLQRQALADALAAWLDHDLPPAVVQVLDGLTDQIISQVTAEARAVLLPRLQAALEEEASASRDD